MKKTSSSTPLLDNTQIESDHEHTDATTHSNTNGNSNNRKK